MATPKKKKCKKKSIIPSDIDIHYVKTDMYRSYHVDGVFGGLTPRGNIYCEFFVERFVTPQKTVNKIEKNGHLGEEKERVGKEGLIRQIECGISLDIKAATDLKIWLEEKIEKYQESILIPEE